MRGVRLIDLHHAFRIAEPLWASQTHGAKVQDLFLLLIACTPFAMDAPRFMKA